MTEGPDTTLLRKEARMGGSQGQAGRSGRDEEEYKLDVTGNGWSRQQRVGVLGCEGREAVH